MKKILLLFVLLTSFQGYSQKDSIVNYLDKKGKRTTNKDKARSFEIITKKTDSLWLVRKYKRNGKLFNYTHYLSKDRKVKVGESVSYNMYGNKISFLLFNSKGEKHGPAKAWFDNGNLSKSSIFIKGKKEGVWKAYHYNGKIAVRKVYKNDSILKADYYNEEQIAIEHDTLYCERKPIFIKGKFSDEVKKITKNLGYEIKGVIYVNFVIDINGKIKDVIIDEKLPKRLHKKIIVFFENIKGWKPGYHLHRKVPVNYSVPLNFR